MPGCSDSEMNDGNDMAADYGCVSRNDIKTACLTVQVDHEMLKIMRNISPSSHSKFFKKKKTTLFKLAAEQFVTKLFVSLYFRHIGYKLS